MQLHYALAGMSQGNHVPGHGPIWSSEPVEMIPKGEPTVMDTNTVYRFELDFPEECALRKEEDGLSGVVVFAPSLAATIPCSPVHLTAL